MERIIEGTRTKVNRDEDSFPVGTFSNPIHLRLELLAACSRYDDIMQERAGHLRLLTRTSIERC